MTILEMSQVPTNILVNVATGGDTDDEYDRREHSLNLVSENRSFLNTKADICNNFLLKALATTLALHG